MQGHGEMSRSASRTDAQVQTRRRGILFLILVRRPPGEPRSTAAGVPRRDGRHRALSHARRYGGYACDADGFATRAHPYRLGFDRRCNRLLEQQRAVGGDSYSDGDGHGHGHRIADRYPQPATFPDRHPKPVTVADRYLQPATVTDRHQ
jgi:hypothetical protein